MALRTMKLSKAQEKSLRFLAARGGWAAGYAGQKGFSVVSIPALLRLGLVERMPPCVKGECLTEEWMESGWTSCRDHYDAVRLTDAGRRAVAGD